MCLTIAATQVVETEDGAGSVGKETAGVDLGEIHIAAVATTRRQALIVSGRLLRSCKRLRNKRHGAYSSLLAHCTPGSRRARQLRKRKRQASAKLTRQQRDILHQASRKVVTYCREESVGRIFVGDVRDVQDGIRHGANNQKIAQWPHGQFYDYLSNKARRIGIHVAYIAEDGSTVTCSACGQRQMSAPRRRTARCTGCGTLHHRDANGAANICSRGCYGRYGLVGVEHITHYRPVAAGQAEGCLLSASQISAKQL
ncbi:MAG: RNA-guided endonuclease InsQ/TnpB family protein [Ktedonobacterales bacterium]